MESAIKVAFVTTSWNKPYIESTSDENDSSLIISQDSYFWVNYAVTRASILFYKVFKISTHTSRLTVVPEKVKTFEPHVIVLEYGILNFKKYTNNIENKIQIIQETYDDFFEYCSTNDIKLVLIMHPNIASYERFHTSFNSKNFYDLDEEQQQTYEAFQTRYYENYLNFIENPELGKNKVFAVDFRGERFFKKVSNKFYLEDGYHLAKSAHKSCGKNVGTILKKVKKVIAKENPNGVASSPPNITSNTKLMYSNEFKIAYLSNKWTKPLRVIEEDAYGNKYTATYYWPQIVLENSSIRNWKLFKLNDYDFNYADVNELNQERDAMGSTSKKSKSKFAKYLKPKLTEYCPHIIMVEYGMHSYRASTYYVEPKEIAKAIMSSYQEIYEFCILNGITMIIVVYKEVNYSNMYVSNIQEYQTFFEELIYQQARFAEVRGLICCNLNEEGSFGSYCYNSDDGYNLSKDGHINFGKIVANVIPKSGMSTHNKNLSKSIMNQIKRDNVYNTATINVDMYSLSKVKIAFLNSAFTKAYYEPQYNYKGGRIGQMKYYWPELVGNRIGNNKWKTFFYARRPLAELIDEYGESIVKYNPGVIVVESGLFDYDPQMYSNEPITRVADIIDYYNEIHNYCVQNKIILIIVSYGTLDYEYYQRLDPDEPLFTEEHKRYHNLLHEKFVDFCYNKDVFCCNLRLDSSFSIENFSSTYLYDGVSLSRTGHLAYSTNVANSIKLALETLNEKIKETNEAVKEAAEMTKYYNKISYNKKINNTVDKILKNANNDENYTVDDHTNNTFSVNPNFPTILSEPLQQSVVRYNKKKVNYTSNSATDSVEKINDSSSFNNSGNSSENNISLNNTDPIKNNNINSNAFKNIGNILKASREIPVSDNASDNDWSNSILYANIDKTLKGSSKDQTKTYIKREQEEQVRQQAISSSFSSNDESEMQGDGQIDDPEQVVSFEICKMLDKDDEHHCKYMDIANKCIFDQCIYDTEELPKFTRKWYTKCLICTEVFARDPRYMKAPFCDSCISRMQAAEKLPFTCVNCGKKQNHPAIIMFSSTCDYCTQHKLFNTCCLKFRMSPAGIYGVDTNHEPVY